MAYEKQNWDVDIPATPERLNHMEEGIVLASKTGGVEVGTIVNIDKNKPTPEGYKDAIGKSIIQVGYNESTAFKVTTTNTKTFVPMAKQLAKTGNGFTVQSDGTVLVNKTMKIRAKAQIMLTASGSGAKILMIDINQYDWSYDRVISLKDYVPLKSDTYILDVKEGDILRLYYQGDANDTFHTSTAFVYMYIEEVDDATKPIEKTAVTPIDPKTGHIFDTTNIDNKAENTYSANVIDGELDKKQDTIANPCYAQSFGGGAVINVNITFKGDYPTFMVITNNCEGFLGQVSTNNGMSSSKITTSTNYSLGVSYKFISGNTIQITTEIYKRFTIISAYPFTAEISYPTS